jgi:hypothetical protein
MQHVVLLSRVASGVAFAEIRSRRMPPMTPFATFVYHIHIEEHNAVDEYHVRKLKKKQIRRAFMF